MRTIMKWLAAAVAGALSCAVLMGAAASEPGVPDSVLEWFKSDSVAYAKAVANGDKDAASFSGDLTVGTVHPVYRFSESFISGQPGNAGQPGNTLVPDNSYIASVSNGAEIVGTVSAHLSTPNSTPSGGLSTDSEFAVELAEVDGLVVTDPRSGQWFSFVGNGLEALNDAARVEVPSTISVDEYQKMVSARVAAARTASEQVGSDAVGGNGPTEATTMNATFGTVALGAFVIAVLAGLGAVLARRHGSAP